MTVEAQNALLKTLEGAANWHSAADDLRSDAGAVANHTVARANH